MSPNWRSNLIQLHHNWTIDLSGRRRRRRRNWVRKQFVRRNKNRRRRPRGKGKGTLPRWPGHCLGRLLSAWNFCCFYSKNRKFILPTDLHHHQHFDLEHKDNRHWIEQNTTNSIVSNQKAGKKISNRESLRWKTEQSSSTETQLSHCCHPPGLGNLEQKVKLELCEKKKVSLWKSTAKLPRKRSRKHRGTFLKILKIVPKLFHSRLPQANETFSCSNCSKIRQGFKVLGKLENQWNFVFFKRSLTIKSLPRISLGGDSVYLGSSNFKTLKYHLFIAYRTLDSIHCCRYQLLNKNKKTKKTKQKKVAKLIGKTQARTDSKWESESGQKEIRGNNCRLQGKSSKLPVKLTKRVDNDPKSIT